MKRHKNIIIDNVNANRRHFDTVCKIAKEINIDVQVFEKPFYCELEELLSRDAQRTGKAKVGEDVIKKWFKELGGKQFKFYNPRVEIFQEHFGNVTSPMNGPEYDPSLPDAIICDLDGTLALIHGRSPYDASDCDIKDLPNKPVIETVIAHHKAGRKIIFCSGREDKYRPETERFIKKHCQYIDDGIDDSVWDIDYELFMRATGDFRKDAIIKDELYQKNIEGKYNVLLVLDDRTSVVHFWRSKGLTCFQVAPGDF